MSLRSMTALATFGLIVATVVGFAICLQLVRAADATERSVAERIAAQRADAQSLITALVDEEVGLRGYLAAGKQELLEPFAHGQLEERDATLRLRRDVDASAQDELDALAQRIANWHKTIVEPQMRKRQTGPIEDLDALLEEGKVSFDEIRDAHENFDLAIVSSGERLRSAAVGDRRNVLIVAIVVAVAILLLSLLGTLYLLRHTVHRAGQEQAVALSKFGEYVQQLTEESELHEAVERVATDLARPSGVHLMVRNASKNRLEVMRPEMPIAEQVKHAILTDPMKCRAVRTLREVTGNARDATVCKCTLGVPPNGSHVCIPMLAAGELVGVANFQGRDANHFNAEQIRQLQGYVGFASATVSTLRLIQATRERALRDGLTGAYNRAFLGEYLAKTLATAKRRNAALSLLMIDLDHFKRINDTHGHLAGDQAIITLARTLQRETRSTDAVVRYGGEEFVVLLVDCGGDMAIQTAERIRTAVEHSVVTGSGIELGTVLRASVGVATFPDHAADETALIAAADAAVYRAKAGGRNRVETATVVASGSAA